MQLTQVRDVPIPQDQVWAAITDARILQACIPGCDSLERVSAIQYNIHVVTRIGPLNATFNGEIRLENMNPPDSYTLVAIGKGGVAGVARGEAHLKLSPIEVDGQEGTRLSYTINAVVGGKLARLGSRLVDAVAMKMANHFFEKFILQITAARNKELDQQN